MVQVSYRLEHQAAKNGSINTNSNLWWNQRTIPWLENTNGEQRNNIACVVHKKSRWRETERRNNNHQFPWTPKQHNFQFRTPDSTIDWSRKLTGLRLNLNENTCWTKTVAAGLATWTLCTRWTSGTSCEQHHISPQIWQYPFLCTASLQSKN